MSKTGSPGVIRYGLVIDLDKCVGCGTCSAACLAENNIYPLPDESDKVRSIAWMRIYRLENGRPFPKTEIAYLPRPCMQCDNPACVPVCPASATTRGEIGGIVSQIHSRCVGCRYCMAACPYHARYFNWFDPWPLQEDHVKRMVNALNPEVSPRPRGVVEKCTFCHHRLMAAKERLALESRSKKSAGPYRLPSAADIPEDYYQPACARACPAGAITFGDLDNSGHRIYRLLKARKADAFRLLERLNTEPRVYYLSARKWIGRLADNTLNAPRNAGR